MARFLEEHNAAETQSGVRIKKSLKKKLTSRNNAV